jgi:uncharacterized repeat protein (TIGR03803 family)
MKSTVWVHITAVLFAISLSIRPAGAQSFTILHTFTGAGQSGFGGARGDGTLPDGALIRDAAGNLYGTTEYGGTGCPILVAPLQFRQLGCGVIFKIVTTGGEVVLHLFGGSGGDGKNPVDSLLRDSAGNLYGTTRLGGAFGWGTVFRLGPTGTEIVLHSFTNERTAGNHSET